MLQYQFKDAHNIFAKYYNLVWIMRWVAFAVSSIIWYKYPRSMYSIFFVSNILMIVLTIKARKSFRWAFKLILVEEILVWLWHFIALMQYFDYYHKRVFSKVFVATLGWFMLLCVIFAFTIELLILLISANKNMKYFHESEVGAPNTPIQVVQS